MECWEAILGQHSQQAPEKSIPETVARDYLGTTGAVPQDGLSNSCTRAGAGAYALQNSFSFSGTRCNGASGERAQPFGADLFAARDALSYALAATRSRRAVHHLAAGARCYLVKQKFLVIGIGGPVGDVRADSTSASRLPLGSPESSRTAVFAAGPPTLQKLHASSSP